MQILQLYTPEQIVKMVKEVKLLGLEPVSPFADSDEYPLYTAAHTARVLCSFHSELDFDRTYNEIVELLDRHIVSVAGWATTNTAISAMNFFDFFRGLFKK